jgi:hypothetical protein
MTKSFDGTLHLLKVSFVGNYSFVERILFSTLAELWALKDGLSLANCLGFSLISVEMDAEMVILLLKNSSTINLVIEPLLSDCRSLMQMFNNPVMQHAYRKANQCTDVLANLSLNLEVFFMDFVNPPPVVENLLAFDKIELFYTRMICV